MQVLIRTYLASDRNELIAIFHSNCPRYFDPADIVDLHYYLDHFADENFKVVLLGGKLVGCGGHYVKPQEKVFGIAWVMFKRNALGGTNFKCNAYLKHTASKLNRLQKMALAKTWIIL